MNEFIEGKYYWIKYKEGETRIIGRFAKSWGKPVFYIDGASEPIPLSSVDVLGEVNYES